MSLPGCPYLSGGAILKKNSVSGVAAGWLKKVRMGTFFFIFAKKKRNPKMDNIFLPNQKKKNHKKKSGLPTGFNNGHPLDRKQKFFLGWPGIFTAHRVPTVHGKPATEDSLTTGLWFHILNVTEWGSPHTGKGGIEIICLVY